MRQSNVQFSAILTKIGNGECLNETETSLLESRFRTVEWCNKNVKNAVRLFHTNQAVDTYNRTHVVAEAHSIAVDVYSGWQNETQLGKARTAAHKKSATETANMIYDLVLTKSFPYVITTNVNLEDGLVNGAIGILRYIEYKHSEAGTMRDSNNICDIYCLWLEFAENSNIGQLTRSKIRHKVLSTPWLEDTWTPIFKRKATFTASPPVKCTRINFPLSLACAMTVHKSQGGTFEQIVFDYSHTLQQQLVYVALSRVTSIDGLYITNQKGHFKFHHANPQRSASLSNLQSELQRLESYKFLTLDHQLLQRLEPVNGIILNLNVGSLPAHSEDLTTDEVLMKADVFCLSETWMSNQSSIDMNGLQLLAQNKRPGKTGGVAILQKQSPHSSPEQPRQPTLSADDAGDFCVSLMDLKGSMTKIITVYINPNTSFEEITAFLDKYKEYFAPSYENDFSPLFVCGDFNYNMKIESKKERLLNFMRQSFGLKLLNDADEPTTTNGTCIDLVFYRHASSASCINHIAYFGCHRPMLILLD